MPRRKSATASGNDLDTLVDSLVTANARFAPKILSNIVDCVSINDFPRLAANDQLVLVLMRMYTKKDDKNKANNTNASALLRQLLVFGQRQGLPCEDDISQRFIDCLLEAVKNDLTEDQEVAVDLMSCIIGWTSPDIHSSIVDQHIETEVATHLVALLKSESVSTAYSALACLVSLGGDASDAQELFTQHAVDKTLSLTRKSLIDTMAQHPGDVRNGDGGGSYEEDGQADTEATETQGGERPVMQSATYPGSCIFESMAALRMLRAVMSCGRTRRLAMLSCSLHDVIRGAVRGAVIGCDVTAAVGLEYSSSVVVEPPVGAKGTSESLHHEDSVSLLTAALATDVLTCIAACGPAGLLHVARALSPKHGTAGSVPAEVLSRHLIRSIVSGGGSSIGIGRMEHALRLQDNDDRPFDCIRHRSWALLGTTVSTSTLWRSSWQQVISMSLQTLQDDRLHTRNKTDEAEAETSEVVGACAQSMGLRTLSAASTSATSLAVSTSSVATASTEEMERMLHAVRQSEREMRRLEERARMDMDSRDARARALTDALEAKLTQTEAIASEATAKLDEAESVVESLREEVEMLTESLDSQRRLTRQVETKLKFLSEREGQLQAEATALRIEADAARGERVTLSTELSDITERLSETSRQLEEKSNEANEARAQCDSTSLRLEDTFHKLITISRAHKLAKEAESTARTEAQTAQAECKKLASEAKTARREAERVMQECEARSSAHASALERCEAAKRAEALKASAAIDDAEAERARADAAGDKAIALERKVAEATREKAAAIGALRAEKASLAKSEAALVAATARADGLDAELTRSKELNDMIHKLSSELRKNDSNGGEGGGGGGGKELVTPAATGGRPKRAASSSKRVLHDTTNFHE